MKKKGVTYASFVDLIFRGGDFRTDQKTWLVRFSNDKNYSQCGYVATAGYALSNSLPSAHPLFLDHNF